MLELTLTCHLGGRDSGLRHIDQAVKRRVSCTVTKEKFLRDTVQTVDTFSIGFRQTGEADFRCCEQSAVSEGFVIVEGSGVDCVERLNELGNQVR